MGITRTNLMSDWNINSRIQNLQGSSVKGIGSWEGGHIWILTLVFVIILSLDILNSHVITTVTFIIHILYCVLCCSISNIVCHHISVIYWFENLVDKIFFNSMEWPQ